MSLRPLLPGPLATLLALAPLGGAAAGPLDDPHVGGVGFGGPTTGDLTAVFWNPAALGLLQGSEATLVLSETLVRPSVERSPVDDQRGGTKSFLPVTGRARRGSLSWPPGPGTFLGVGTAIGNRFTLAVALYAPYAQRTTFGATSDGVLPTRYHLIDADLRHVALVPAVAFRIGNEVRFGVAPGFLFSSGRLVFDEDTALANPSRPCGAEPCGVENPAQAARYSLASGLGILDGSVSFTLAAGLHFRRGRFQAGLAFASRPLGPDGVAIDVPESDVQPAGGQAPLCAQNRTPPCSFGRLSYDLPDTFSAGASWQATPTVTVTGIVRWLTLSRHDRIAIRVVGAPATNLGTADLPDTITLYRGFRDVVEGRVRVEREVGGWLRVGAAFRADTGSVPASHLSPSSAGGSPTFEPAVMIALRRPSWLRVTAGYAFAVTPAVTADPSVFDPAAARQCAEAGQDLGAAGCVKQLAGAARPSATGRYSAIGHTGSLNATVVF